MPVLSYEQMAHRMAELVSGIDSDLEGSHMEMDRLMVQTLSELGYTEAMDIYAAAPKWYA